MITPQKLVINHFKNEPRTMRPVLNRRVEENLRGFDNVPNSLRDDTKYNNITYENLKLISNNG